MSLLFKPKFENEIFFRETSPSGALLPLQPDDQPFDDRTSPTERNVGQKDQSPFEEFALSLQVSKFRVSASLILSHLDFRGQASIQIFNKNFYNFYFSGCEMDF